MSDVRNGNNSNRMNPHLYSSMIKYGVDSFEMFPLEFVDEEHISERELWWMQHLNSLNQNKGYNLRSDSSSGMHVHDETRKKISRRVKKEWEDGKRNGHSDKLKEAWKNRDRAEQGRTLSATLTKYSYIVTHEDGHVETYSYRELQENGLSNVIAKFHKKKSSIEKFKNVTIERVFIHESKTQGCVST